TEEKTAPDGTAWPAWSPRYANTRHSGHSLLRAEGGLLDSIQFLVSDDAVEVGSNLVYAATHQFGDAKRKIPPRPYLGLSAQDQADIERLLINTLDGVLQ
ncbi:MAG TPA: phage virion morphogenesis protein, partial [Methylomirabilota bacterium]|nr:phage virion morphogenesis protein [Methylomirabilota bacterium]